MQNQTEEQTEKQVEKKATKRRRPRINFPKRIKTLNT